MLCASQITASENEPSLFSLMHHVYSYHVSVFMIIVCVCVIEYQFLLTCLAFNAAFSSCAWVLNFLHCERPKTNDSLGCTCLYLASFPLPRPCPSFWLDASRMHICVLGVKIYTAARACFSVHSGIRTESDGKLGGACE